MTKKMVATVALIICVALPCLADNVSIDIFSGFITAGGGAPFSGLAGSLTSSDIMFATNTGYNWHPLGLVSFGADMTGSLFVSATSSYTFTLNSDDGSELFIDGSLVVDDGGAHPPLTVSGTATLTAGVHPFELRFFECCGGTSGVDLTLPTGVSFAPSAPVPEPTSLLLVVMGAGVLCIWQFCFRRGMKRVPSSSYVL